MRKNYLIVLLILCLVLSACGKKEAPAVAAATEPPIEEATEPAVSEAPSEPSASSSAAPAVSTAPAPASEATPTPSAAPTASPTPVPGTSGAKTDYEVFLELSAADKDAFMNSFDSIEEFYDWLVAAQAAYSEAKEEPIMIGSDGKIVIGPTA